jgi:histidyl-tRNA synthetase
MQFGPPRGTRDFYPEDMRMRNWLFGIWRETALRYGFEEYDGPVLESEELYVLKSGEEILSQLYNFSDKGGRRVALRPEMTPTMARMIGARGGRLTRPIKWFAIVQCFRYERMSLGRKREHYQWNLDIVGIKEVTAEAELIAAALDALSALGIDLGEVVVRISHRGILQALLESLELPREKWPGVFGVIDKHGKESEDVLRAMLVSLGITHDTTQCIFRLFEVRDIGEMAGLLSGSEGSSAAVKEVDTLFRLLEGYGIKEYCEFAPTIVRGLPYYTGIVFECFDREGRFRAIFGGGRYDHLLDMFGAEGSPSVGLGFGDVVVGEIVNARRSVPAFSKYIDYFIIPYSDAERSQAISLAQELRRLGSRVDMPLEIRRLKRALADADRAGARDAILVVPEELRDTKVIVRHMASGEEEKVDVRELIALVSGGNSTERKDSGEGTHGRIRR